MQESAIVKRPRNFVIGLTGSVGSGCSTISKSLEKSGGFKRVSLSDPIKEEFKKKHPKKEPKIESYGNDWRKELQNIGNEGRKQSNSYWINLALKDISEDFEGDIVIDGIRNALEVEELRNKYPNFFLVAVYADFNIRWERVIKFYNHDQGIFIRDEERDRDEDDRLGQNVGKCVDLADYVVVNTEQIEQPEEQRWTTLHNNELKEPIERMKHGRGRPPFPDEVHMTTATSVSHASMCLKRHVGAVIVNNDNIPLSIGFNENPIGIGPCVTKPSRSCYKDDIMQKKLEDMLPFHCPRCGIKQEAITKPWKCSECRENLLLVFFPSRGMELCTAIHAEERAIRSLGDKDVRDCTLYVNTFPCFQCSRYLLDAGIRKVVYVEAYPVPEAEKFLLDNNVEIVPFKGFKARAFHTVFKQVE